MLERLSQWFYYSQGLTQLGFLERGRFSTCVSKIRLFRKLVDNIGRRIFSLIHGRFPIDRLESFPWHISEPLDYCDHIGDLFMNYEADSLFENVLKVLKRFFEIPIKYIVLINAWKDEEESVLIWLLTCFWRSKWPAWWHYAVPKHVQLVGMIRNQAL